ncbi:MAG: peptide deformylase [Candidatus Omnitrophica bacterium]|nr:peptide deformylase [Candidatus Omnitrophota bacterium]
MSLLSLRVDPDPVLCRPAQPVARVDEEIRRLAQDMIETMYANDGIGLAAPQVGRDLQLFVASPTRERGRELVVVNPVLEAARGRNSIVEGCLSVPQVWEKVPRATWVRLRGLDGTGTPFALETEGLLAIVLQHETDHLQGRLFLDRLPWWHRRRLPRLTRRRACA